MRNLVDHDGRTMWFKVIVVLFAFPLIKLMLAFTVWHKIFAGRLFLQIGDFMYFAGTKFCD